jgi:hypothetical protein
VRFPHLVGKIIPHHEHEISGQQLGKVYHGSPVHIKEVDPRRLQTTDDGFFGPGFYGSTDFKTAGSYRRMGNGGYNHHKPVGVKHNSAIKSFSLIPTAKVLRYHRDVSKNHPMFVERVLQHARKHSDETHYDHEGGDSYLVKDPNHDYFPHKWDKLVQHYADHHNFDAVHVLHHTYGKTDKEVPRHEYNERDEVRVRNINAIQGHEQQKKLPGMEKYINYTMPGTKRTSVYSKAGKQLGIWKKRKRKQDHFIRPDDIPKFNNDWD